MIKLVLHTISLDFSATSTFSNALIKVHKWKDDSMCARYLDLSEVISLRKEWLFDQAKESDEIGQTRARLFTMKNNLVYNYDLTPENRFSMLFVR